MTVSDTRALADDKSGTTLAERIEKAATRRRPRHRPPTMWMKSAPG